MRNSAYGKKRSKIFYLSGADTFLSPGIHEHFLNVRASRHSAGLPLARRIVGRARFEALWIHWYCVGQRALTGMLLGRRIAIVGSAPGLIGQRLGPEIDAHDLVLRINAPRNHGRESDYGARTDLVFMGANIRDSAPVRDVLRCAPSAAILTRRCNIAEIDAVGGVGRVLLLPDGYADRTTRRAARSMGYSKWHRTSPPPRSGAVIALAVATEFAPQRLTLYGFSKDTKDGWATITTTGSVASYPQDHMTKHHCPMQTEIELLHAAVVAGRGTIVWRD